MNQLASHQRERLKERLITFAKTIPKLVEDNRLDDVLMRLENCRLLVVEITAMKLNEKMEGK